MIGSDDPNNPECQSKIEELYHSVKMDKNRFAGDVRGGLFEFARQRVTSLTNPAKAFFV